MHAGELFISLDADKDGKISAQDLRLACVRCLNFRG